MVGCIAHMGAHTLRQHHVWPNNAYTQHRFKLRAVSTATLPGAQYACQLTFKHALAQSWEVKAGLQQVTW